MAPTLSCNKGIMKENSGAQVHQAPCDEDARKVAVSHLGSSDCTIRRYPTGLCHYVYEVVPKDEKPFVVRMSRSDLGGMLRSAQYWSDVLRPMGVPLPATLAANFDAQFPYMILERLDGRDLGEVYATLTPAIRKQAAQSVASWQLIAASLPEARGFGYAASFDDPQLLSSWAEVLDSQMNRTRAWMQTGGVGQLSMVDRVQELIHQERAYLDDIKPRPFLHDTTTKNVLVSERGVHGVVDIDDVCFGDRLYVLSLTNMAFISMRLDMDYITYWREAWNLSSLQEKMLRLYTAAHCACFISELGLGFNKAAAPVDQERKLLLEETFEALVSQ